MPADISAGGSFGRMLGARNIFASLGNVADGIGEHDAVRKPQGKGFDICYPSAGTGRIISRFMVSSYTDCP